IHVPPQCGVASCREVLIAGSSERNRTMCAAAVNPPAQVHRSKQRRPRERRGATVERSPAKCPRSEEWNNDHLVEPKTTCKLLPARARSDEVRLRRRDLVIGSRTTEILCSSASQGIGNAWSLPEENHDVRKGDRAHGEESRFLHS